MIGSMADESPGVMIRRARQEARMKQRELADRMGVHPTTIGLWERNKFFPEQHWAALNKLLHIELRPPGAPAPGPPEQPTISADLLAAIRRTLPDDPEAQQRVIDAVERTMRGEPPPSARSEAGDSRERRAAS